MPNYQDDPIVSVSLSTNTPAVHGEGSDNEGVRGVSHNASGGVVGVNDWSPSEPQEAGGNGDWFESSQGEGVRGWAKSKFHGGVVGVNTAGGFGVYGRSDDGVGVVGESKYHEGVRGVSHSKHHGAAQAYWVRATTASVYRESAFTLKGFMLKQNLHRQRQSLPII